jgi:hypothetical protein
MKEKYPLEFEIAKPDDPIYTDGGITVVTMQRPIKPPKNFIEPAEEVMKEAEQLLRLRLEALAKQTKKEK